MQHTIKTKNSTSGIGLHTGKNIDISFFPAPANTGIVFRRTDIHDKDNIIKAKAENVTQTTLCTKLENSSGVQIATIEHLMSALAMQGIDNIFIDVNGPEIPILDGSSQHFLIWLDMMGRQEQSAQRQYIKILRPIRVNDKDKYAVLSPSSKFDLSFEIDFSSKYVGKQHMTCLDMNLARYRAEIARARTFCFHNEIVGMQQLGFARGGSLNNAIVVGESGVINEEGLRYPDEFVRHKILDAIGDLYVCGAPIIGRYHGYKAGHSLNNKLLRALLDDQSRWTFVTSADQEDSEDAYEGLAASSLAGHNLSSDSWVQRTRAAMMAVL